MESEMETPKDLLKYYIELRDEIVTNGIDSRRRVIRQLLNVAMQSYRAQQRYYRARAQFSDGTEAPECPMVLTAAACRNLTKAAAVNKEIGTHLSELRMRRRKARH
jgi:hypothetical protein